MVLHHLRIVAAGMRAAFVLFAVTLLNAGCGGPQTSAGDTLIFGRNKDAVSLDFALAPDGNSLNVARSTSEGLTRYKPGSFDVEPSLATSWTESKDGKTWIFTLRNGVKFHDGTAFDADAVKFNFDRWRFTNNPYHKWGDFAYYASQFGGYPGTIARVTVLAPDRVEFGLTRPVAPLLVDFAMPSFSISSPAAVKSQGENYFLHPIGTGPYMLTEWVRDDHITLTAFPDYWGVKAKIKTVILRDIPDASTSLLALQHGDIDGWEYPQPDILPQIRKDPKLTVYHLPPNNLMFLSMNELHAPFTNVLVRRAIAEAIDTRAIVRDFYDPSAVPADEFLPAAVRPHGVVTPYAYDPVDARRLLAQAGFPHGFTTHLWFMTAPRPYLPEPQRVAEAIQQDLAKVGIQATMQGFEWGVYLAKVQGGEHDLALYGWSGDNGDPDNFLYALLDKDSARPPGANNVCFWKNDAFHALMMAGQVETDPVKRDAIYRKAILLVHDQVPAVPIAHNSPPTVFRSGVNGFIPNPDTAEDFNLMSLSH
ncbi:MAG TPA: ABC transporter substrate-binding protein [Candidatus Eremiobacteraceae bacterium]